MAEPRAQRALVSGAVYALAGASQRALGLLLLPLYTRALTPAEYGDLSVILSISTAIVILLALGLDSALFRTYFGLQGDSYAQANLVWSAWVLTCVTAVAGCLVFTGAAFLLLQHNRLEPVDMALGVWSAGALVISTTVPLTVLRAEQRLKDFITLTVISAILTTGLTVTAVIVLDLGIEGWLLAAVTANAISAVVAALIIPFHRPHPMDWPHLRSALKIGVPLMPHFLSHWALQLADRAALIGLVSASAVGIYSLTANLSLPAMIAVQSLNQGLMPMYARAAHSADERKGIATVATTQLIIAASLCLICAVLLPPLVTVIAPASFSGAASLVPWLVLGYAFLGAYYIPMNSLSLVMGRTSFVWVTTASSAALNLGLIYWLVPDHGLRAAAIASAAGYLLLLLGTTLYAVVLGSPVGLEWRRAITGLAAIVVVYAAFALLTPDEGVAGLAVRGGIVMAGAAVAGGLMMRRRDGRAPAEEAAG
ncbi:lipopolysaccharide biosynthesis protein [Baekduia sp.]|uniref:lipopolysaccharide biosynthesis protein n=1 Tax=Baekduia sp. TaxID=2600305 RepID=UPI002E0B29A5|nr:oligosaccharide flippase family protein [Baekduia sp.]